MIAHLPAGYLITKCYMRHWHIHSRSLLVCGLLASIFPDTDLLLFYFVDARQYHHHDYWLHRPALWLGLGMVAYLCARITRCHKAIPYIIVSSANLLLHMVLDTIAGGIQWLYPLSEQRYTGIEIPATHDWWVWNFILHWTFLLEILIIASALIIWKRSCPTPS